MVIPLYQWMTNVWLEFLVLESRSHCLDNCLFQLMIVDVLFPMETEWSRKKDIRYMIAVCWYDAYQWIRERSALPTITYQHQHISSVVLSSLLSVLTVQFRSTNQWFLSKSRADNLPGSLSLSHYSHCVENNEIIDWVTYFHTPHPIMPHIAYWHLICWEMD